MFRWMLAWLVSEECGLLVIVISGMFWCLIIGRMNSSLLVLLELDSVSIMFCGRIMFRLLWLVLFGCMKNVGVLVEVRVVVILCLMCLDLFMLLIISCFW